MKIFVNRNKTTLKNKQQPLYDKNVKKHKFWCYRWVHMNESDTSLKLKRNTYSLYVSKI